MSLSFFFSLIHDNQSNQISDMNVLETLKRKGPYQARQKKNPVLRARPTAFSPFFAIRLPVEQFFPLCLIKQFVNSMKQKVIFVTFIDFKCCCFLNKYIYLCVGVWMGCVGVRTDLYYRDMPYFIDRNQNCWLISKQTGLVDH